MTTFSPPLCYKYTVLCETEGAWVQGWNWKVPNGAFRCPNNEAHVIDTGNVVIMDKRVDPPAAPTHVRTVEEYAPTQGNYQAQGIGLAVNANSSATLRMSWPYPVSILTARLSTDSSQEGDGMTVVAAPNTTVGGLTQNAPAGSNVFYVSQSVIDNACVGYDVSLSDGVQPVQSLGVITTLYLDRLVSNNASTTAFSAASPTLVQVTKVIVRDLTLGPSNEYVFGASTVGAISLPATTPVLFQYSNNGGTAKTVRGMVEYYY